MQECDTESGHQWAVLDRISFPHTWVWMACVKYSTYPVGKYKSVDEDMKYKYNSR